MATFTGRIQHLCLLTGGSTPAGLARAITGTYSIDTGACEFEGIGNRIVALKGCCTASIDIEAVGLLKAELVKFFPSTASSDPSALTPMLLVTETGVAFKLENGTGGPCTVSVGADDKSFVNVKATAQFGKVTEGTGSPVYLTTGGHTRKHVSATIDTAAAGMQTFDLSNGLTLEPDNSLDARTGGSEDAIAGYLFGEMKPTFSCTLRNSLEAADDFIAGDAGGDYVPHDIVIAIANGTSGENLTFTLSDWIAPVYKGDLKAQGVVYYGYEFQRGTGALSGRCALT